MLSQTSWEPATMVELDIEDSRYPGENYSDTLTQVHAQGCVVYFLVSF